MREDGDHQVVFVVANDLARRREVTAGQRVGELREITQGLTAGERVVLAPPPALRDGARVREEAP